MYCEVSYSYESYIQSGYIAQVHLKQVEYYAKPYNCRNDDYGYQSGGISCGILRELTDSKHRPIPMTTSIAGTVQSTLASDTVGLVENNFD